MYSPIVSVPLPSNVLARQVQARTLQQPSREIRLLMKMVSPTKSLWRARASEAFPAERASQRTGPRKVDVSAAVVLARDGRRRLVEARTSVRRSAVLQMSVFEQRSWAEVRRVVRVYVDHYCGDCFYYSAAARLFCCSEIVNFYRYVTVCFDR